MGNYECKYCECPYEYYSNKKHADRQSCLISKNKYHFFQNRLLNMFQRLRNFISCSKNNFK